jgi:hypothetical protein
MKRLSEKVESKTCLFLKAYHKENLRWATKSEQVSSQIYAVENRIRDQADY